jgi:hypothetical protein
MIKELLIGTLLFSTVANATQAPKTGCILAQRGEVILDWKDNDNHIGHFKNVIYNPIKVEGSNFRKILVGSKLKVLSSDDNLLFTIVDIHANKKQKGKPRTGNIEMQVDTSIGTKSFDMKYTYSNNMMEASGRVNLLKYKLISFKMKIEAILCSAPKNKK